ncbi:MAG: adenylate/guanylate cyclase domain-containing protein, partial [Bacteroidota bacterium]
FWQNIEYVLKFRKKIQGKRVETEYFESLTSLEKKVKEFDQDTRHPYWQLVFTGSQNSLSPELNRHFKERKTLIASVSPDPVYIPNDPDNLQKLFESGEALNGDKLVIAKNKLKAEPKDLSHIRFFNLQLAPDSGQVQSNSPAYLILKLSSDIQNFINPECQQKDSLATIEEQILNIAQNRLLLSNDNFIEITNNAVNLKKQALENAALANEARKNAQATTREAQKQRKLAEQRRMDAEMATRKARSSAQIAKEQTALAELRRLDAESARQAAVDSAKVALEQRKLAEQRRIDAEKATQAARDAEARAKEDRDQAKRDEERALAAEEKAKQFLNFLIIGGILVFLIIGLFTYFRFKLVRENNEKTKNLLLNVLPPAIVDELQTTGKTTMRKYERVSIIFTDFKGFSEITKNMTGDEMIEELNDCFTNFDEIIKKYNLDRIKTIGDAYMCAGGLPDINYTNPLDSILASLEMQRFMRQRYEERNGNYWMCRLGVNVGSVRAGVVGTTKFAYDLWGNAVNTASRLESAGEVYKVNTNDSTYELVKDFFEAEYRGEIQVKHGVLIPMYFINGIRPELSQNADGITPNARFNQKREDFIIRLREEVKRLEALDSLV